MVRYTENVSVASTEVVVQSSGAVSAATTLGPGTYIVGGTDHDTAAHSGTWSFRLTVNPPPGETVCIGNPAPAGFVVTAVYVNRSGCGHDNRFGFNAVTYSPASNPMTVCSGVGVRSTIPAGYVPTAMSTTTACDLADRNVFGFNAVTYRLAPNRSVLPG